MPTTFPPSRFSALRHVLSVDARAHGRSRNQVDGQMSRLSPYLTHGLISVPEVLGCWRLRYGLTLRDPLCQALVRREFLHHLWRHRAEGILEDLHPSGGEAQPAALPADIRRAVTGIPVIDRSVRMLYSSGHLHHQQRLWLASYCIHVRKLPWRLGADWMYGHLLDGDLGVNHLSWQAVAGQLDGKPYLFTNDNVRHAAPTLDSPGSLFDCSHAELRQRLTDSTATASNVLPLSGREPALLTRPPDLVGTRDLARLARGRKLALIHPWMLERRPSAGLVVGVIHLPFHARFPWSTLRWQFVIARMRALCDAFFVGDLLQARQWLDDVDIAVAEDTLNFGYAEALRHPRLQLAEAPRALPEPGAPCASFDAWFKSAMRHAPEWFERSLSDQLAELRAEQRADLRAGLRSGDAGR